MDSPENIYEINQYIYRKKNEQLFHFQFIFLTIVQILFIT